MVQKKKRMPKEEIWFSAAKEGKYELLASLLTENPNLINHSERTGCTALHHAARYGHEAVVARLLAANPKMTRDAQGMTALHYAVNQGHNKVVTQLLARVNPDKLIEVDRFGRTLTQMAANGGLEHIAEILLMKYPQGVRVVDNFGDTLLHSAVQYCSREFAEKLLQMYPGALDIQNENYGYTPFQHAVRAGRDDMIDLFQWKLSFFDMERQCDECNRCGDYRARGIPLLRQQCESLTRQLPRDVLHVVSDYLGFVAFFGTS